MAQKYYAAADIGGTKVALGLFGEDKTLVGKGQFASDPGLPGEAFFTQVVEELRALCREHEVDPAGLAGLGIGVPGMVKFYEGRVALCAMLPGLNGFPVEEFVTSLLPGVKVVVDNDGHCAALAESRQGAGRGFPHMLYCPVSTGLSCWGRGAFP